jgi:hypothetical protein
MLLFISVISNLIISKVILSKVVTSKVIMSKVVISKVALSKVILSKVIISKAFISKVFLSNVVVSLINTGRYLSVRQLEEGASRPVPRLKHVSSLLPVEAIEQPGPLKLKSDGPML